MYRLWNDRASSDARCQKTTEDKSLLRLAPHLPPRTVTITRWPRDHAPRLVSPGF